MATTANPSTQYPPAPCPKIHRGYDAPDEAKEIARHLVEKYPEHDFVVDSEELSTIGSGGGTTGLKTQKAALTMKKLEGANKHHDPIKVFLDLETAIRMEFFDFKEKWDALLP
jgi:hypothetical protein